jgi:SAM-dependent MidA family methyltransferase
VTQQQFLQAMGIEIRLEILLKSSQNEKQKSDLKSGVEMLLKEMGQKFKFLSLFPQNSQQLFIDNPCPGFDQLSVESQK